VGGGLPFFILEINMPCTIHIKTDTHSGGRVNYSTGDISKDERGVYMKGYPVGKYDDPKKPRGYKEGLPYFCEVYVTDASAAEIDAMIASTFSGTSLEQEWEREIDFATVNNDPVIDGWRIRVFATNPGFSNKAGITQAMVENYLTKWNAEVFSATTNEVVFDVAIFEDISSNPGAIQSEGFWNAIVDSIVFTETDYDSGTGVHTIEADYSATVFDPDAVQKRAEDRGGVVSSNVSGVITFVINRTDIFEYFQREIKKILEQRIYRRQFRIPETIVDTIISTGATEVVSHPKGDVTYVILNRTLAQIESFLINRLDEDL
jgi:hypothetical protein